MGIKITSEPFWDQSLLEIVLFAVKPDCTIEILFDLLK